MKTTLCIVLSSVCALAFSVFAETTYVVENRPGYNAWPVITTLGDRLVISYSRGKAHDCSEGCRDAIVRTSTDGARTWTPEHVFVGHPDICEGAEGSGHDSNGALLFWLRCWGRSSVTHELYRSSDAVHFKRISVPKFDPFPIQVMDVVPVPGLGLISLWFGGDYQAERGHSWGYLLSKDDGQTWSQITVERDLPKSEWPTEQSLVYLGGGRLLAVARVENTVGACLGQLYSEDFGHTWRRSKTSITDVLQSTPALLYDAAEETLTLYYFQRGKGLMKRRTSKLSAAVADSMTAWSPPQIVAYGRKIRPYDSGNVKAVRHKGSDYLAYYAGDERNVSVLVSVVGRGETAPESLEGRRVLFLGNPDRAAVREFARTNRCEALVYPTRTEAYRHHPNGAFAREFANAADMPEMGSREAVVPPLSGLALPPPSPLFLEPKGGTNLLVNASFEMGKVGHQVAFEVPCTSRCEQIRAQVVTGDAVHGTKFLRIDTSVTRCRAFYLSNVPRTRCGSNVVYSVWLKADAPGLTAEVELFGRSFNFHDPKPARWISAKTTFKLKETWTRHEVRFKVPDELPFVQPRLVFMQPGVYGIDAEQLEIGDRATPFAPAAVVEGAYRLRQTIFVQADTAEMRQNPPVRTAELVSHDYRTGETSVQTVSFRTPRYGCFSLSGTLAGRPVLPAEYAVVHELGAYSGEGMFIGLNGGIGGVRTGWDVPRSWYRTEEDSPTDYFRLMRLAGVRMLRLWDGSFGWKALEPEKGAYNWGPLDFVTDLVRRNGMEPMFVLGGTAFLKWKDPSRDRQYTNWFVRLNAKPARKTGMPQWTEALELRDADWTDFARDAVRRYRGRINYWETINEPNLQVADTDYYVRLMKLTYETVKRENPAATVVGICATGDLGGKLNSFCAEVGEKGGFKYLDWMSFHPYNGATDVTPRTAEEQMAGVKRLVEKYRPGCPLLEDELYYICDNAVEKLENRGRNWRATNLIRRHVLDFAAGCVGSTPLHQEQIWGAGPEISGITATMHLFRHRLYANELFVVSNAFAYFLEGGHFLHKPDLPEGVNGGVFRDRTGREVTVLWAKRAADARDWPVPAKCTAYDCFGNRLAGETLKLTEDAIYLVQN